MKFKLSVEGISVQAPSIDLSLELKGITVEQEMTGDEMCEYLGGLIGVITTLQETAFAELNARMGKVNLSVL